MTSPSLDLSFNIANLLDLIAAIGGLGTAAYGLVDATKAFGGGMSNPGFGFVRRGVAPFLIDTKGLGAAKVIETLRANWLNGVAKADQKAAAKSMIHMGLTAANAAKLAEVTGLDPALLQTAAANARSINAASGGQSERRVTTQDMTVLGEFDVIVSAALDQAYERADQFYRNWAKLAAAGVAIVLAVLGGGIGQENYLWSAHMWSAVLVGALATPVAPIAKDLSTSLSTAVKAVGTYKR
ncbi:MAG: hypothetical protein M3O36_17830 [Myxococcota bacterium]|nr:hypothetical protein [Myxococcota bacterium]